MADERVDEQVGGERGRKKLVIKELIFLPTYL